MEPGCYWATGRPVCHGGALLREVQKGRLTVKVILTGGAGYIGIHVLLELLAGGAAATEGNSTFPAGTEADLHCLYFFSILIYLSWESRAARKGGWNVLQHRLQGHGLNRDDTTRPMPA